ncbi:hypothetical protein SEA_STIGMA_123 [Streptomyces phage Stigma]|nr:hypothetical protein SEA_STIGMA_123 [Streptomyces phage Stigma]
MSCFEVSQEKLKEKIPAIKDIFLYMKSEEFQREMEETLKHPSTRVNYLELMKR